MKESVIQKAVLDFLELYSRTHNIYFFRAGVGNVQTMQGRRFKTGKAGCPDIIALVPDKKTGMGKFLGLEIKTKTGRQSPSQKIAQAEIEAAGGEYHLVRSLGDIKAILK